MVFKFKVMINTRVGHIGKNSMITVKPRQHMELQKMFYKQHDYLENYGFRKWLEEIG